MEQENIHNIYIRSIINIQDNKILLSEAVNIITTTNLKQNKDLSGKLQEEDRTFNK